MTVVPQTQAPASRRTRDSVPRPVAEAPLWRRATVWGTVAIAVAYVLHAVCVDFIADDGYIGFRYVQNLQAGSGLVYNLGETVEGYTNFLWLMLLAATSWIVPGVELIHLAQGLSMGFGVLAILVAVRFSGRVHGGAGGLALFAAAWIAADTSQVAWSTSGLETMMFAALALLAALSYLTAVQTGVRPWRAAVWFALLSMTRPDGLLLFGVTSLHYLVVEWRRCRRVPWVTGLTWAAPFLALYLPYFLWRYHYYGELLPNTYHVKAGSPAMVRRGLEYLFEFASGRGLYVFAPAAVVLLWRPRVMWRDYLALLVASYLAYVIWVGGDGLGFHRFVSHVGPLLFLLVQDGVVTVVHRLRPWLIRVGPRFPAVITLLLCAPALLLAARDSAPALGLWRASTWHEVQCGLRFPGDGSVHDYVWFDNYFVDRQAHAARWLDQHLPGDSLVAATPAGSIAAHMDLPVLDMLGLNDHHIARTAPGRVGFFRTGHMKGDGGYVLERNPAAILMGNVCVLPEPLEHEEMQAKLVRKSEHELWADPRFHERYDLVRIRLHETGPFQWFMFYARRDLAPRLSQASR